MCGISGFFGTGDEHALHAMADAISHRGPDARGYEFFANSVLGTVALAHNRLSIIDLSPNGNQPLWNEDKTVCIVFNGEIYNFKKLRAQLTSTHTFIGNSDTEVIVHLFEEVGENVFEQLHGMFALVLYDGRNSLAPKVYAARDRMGEKPFYYSLISNSNTLIFGSELKALRQHPLFEPTLSRSALAEYLVEEHVIAPRTIYEHVHKLEPGHYMVYDGRAITNKPFWQRTLGGMTTGHESFTTALETLDTLLGRSVEEQMVSDVPVGIFLSGGIDSSTIAWYASRHAKQHGQTIKTFSIGFHERSYDESAFARQVAKHLGTDHHEHLVTANDTLAIVAKLPELLDEPMADASIIPTYILSQHTRRQVTVALGGDGGDELLYGYDTFVAQALLNKLFWFPRQILAGILSLARFLPVSHGNMGLDFKIKKFREGLIATDAHERNRRWLSAFSPEELPKVLAAMPTKYSATTLSPDLPAYSALQNVAHQFETEYLPEHVLVKVDRASMSHSLEVRAPFLATAVVEFIHGLPDKFKLKGTTTKYILKQLMKGRLPDTILNRKKKGFGIPVASWLINELAPLVTKYLGKEFIEKQGIFCSDYIEKLVREHTNRAADHKKKLWTLLVFQLWYERWIR
jgi:asparagine synthase (glutamine-hydrolysing)